MTWATELAKAENDALRTSGDVAGIIAKYSASAGAVTWVDSPFGEFVSIVGDVWMKNLTNAQRDALLETHTDVTGNVTLSNSATRSALAPLLDAAQTQQMTDGFSSQDTLAGTLGLVLRKEPIQRALEAFADSPSGDAILKWVQIKAIRDKQHLLEQTSLANLITIESLIGV